MKGCLTPCFIAQNYLARVMHKVKNDEPPTVEKILAACDEENKSIFADQTAEDIELGKKLCSCSANKIMTLDKEKQTDGDNLKNIFMDCARQLRE